MNGRGHVWLGLVALGAAVLASPGAAQEEAFTTEFDLERCRFGTRADNAYFRLLPGWTLALEGEDEGETERVEIRVLRDKVDVFLPGVGRVRTRVVEEREWVDGELVEVSRNFFAACRQTLDVFYFGEDVDIYDEDGSVTHDGAWRAGEPDGDGVAEPGLIMPGRFLLGSRYYQELADGIALDRAEHVEMGISFETPAGAFDGCVRVIETSPLEPDEESEKVYCPGVGLVYDDGVVLVEYGFARGRGQEEDDEDED